MYPDFCEACPAGLKASGSWSLGWTARHRALTPRQSSTPHGSSPDQIEWTAAGLLIPGSRVGGVLDQGRFFNGFDEVVIFDQKPMMLPPIESRFATDEAVPERGLVELGAYLEHHGAVAAAGDGAGLVWIRRS